MAKGEVADLELFAVVKLMLCRKPQPSAMV